MDIYLSKYKLNPKDKWTQAFAKVVIAQLRQRFPSAPDTTSGTSGRYILGSATNLYVCGLFIHPFF